MNFASDNAAGAAPEIMAALARVNDGHALAYGNDDLTRNLERTFCDLFEREVAVFLVATGTAANALALAGVTPPWGAVLCHQDAHIATSEAGAPEFFGGGLKLIGLPGDGCKIGETTLRSVLAHGDWSPPHHVASAALSLTQATEAGTIYRPDEIAQLAGIASLHEMAVHMDGARFANAVAQLNVSPADLTWRSGVDVLSFGATKGGALAAEAIVFFDAARAADMDRRRKRGGHLVSKHRFVAAQFDAFLRDGLWLRLARHANVQAHRLAEGLKELGIAPVWPVEANLVFVMLPPAVHERLQDAGASYYVMPARGLPASLHPAPGAMLARLVTSFATTDSDVERFIAAARSA